MPTFKYALRASKKDKWNKGTLVDSIEWKTVEQAKAGLEKQYPGMEVYVKLHNERPYIENRAQCKKSSKEIGEAGIAALKARLRQEDL